MFLLGLGAAGILADIVCLVALHLLPTGYRPVPDAVSDYGVGPYRGWYWAQSFALAVAALAAAFGVAPLLDGDGAFLGVVVVFACARSAITQFPTDLSAAPRTPSGRIHLVLAVLQFAATVVAAYELRGLVGSQSALGSVRPELDLLPRLLIIVLIAMGLIGRRTKAFGLIERLFYALTLAWLAAMVIGGLAAHP